MKKMTKHNYSTSTGLFGALVLCFGTFQVTTYFTGWIANYCFSCPLDTSFMLEHVATTAPGVLGVIIAMWLRNLEIHTTRIEDLRRTRQSSEFQMHSSARNIDASQKDSQF